MADTLPIPPTMTAIAVAGGRGPPEALKPVVVATPAPRPGQVLIRVAAAGVNRPDVLQRNGAYPPPPGAPDTLGLEVAGVVAVLGDNAPRWALGDRVCALLGGGGYAQYAAVDARHVLPIPAGLSMTEAGGLPETVCTVFSNVFERGRLQSGETLLVHGATSGIGATAIAMAKAAGARVIATSRSAAKARRALALGADLAIDTSAENFVDAVKASGGADVVLDMVGGPFLQMDLEALKPDGRLCVIAFQAGAEVELNLQPMLTKRLTLTAAALRNRSADEKARLIAAVEAAVWPWIAEGRVRLPIDRSFPLVEAATAHAYLEAGDHVGKVMLTA